MREPANKSVHLATRIFALVGLLLTLGCSQNRVVFHDRLERSFTPAETADHLLLPIRLETDKTYILNFTANAGKDKQPASGRSSLLLANDENELILGWTCSMDDKTGISTWIFSSPGIPAHEIRIFASNEAQLKIYIDPTREVVYGELRVDGEEYRTNYRELKRTQQQEISRIALQRDGPTDANDPKNRVNFADISLLEQKEKAVARNPDKSAG